MRYGHAGRHTGSWVAGIGIVVAALAGCGNGSGRSQGEAPGFADAVPSAPPMQASGAPVVLARAEAGNAPTSLAVAPESPVAPARQPSVAGPRKIMRNGTMQLEVAGLDEALDTLRTLVSASGGYLAGESRSQNDGQGRRATVTCRVPVERLDDIVARLRSAGRELSLDMTADDISEQYYNLEIRLETQRQLESRLRDLITRPSNRLSDLLEIEREIARVRGEIDEMEGRKRFWDQHVALAVLTVQLQEPRPLVAGDEGGIWRTLRRAFGESADNFVGAVAGLIAAAGGVIPVLVAVVALLWVLRALWRRTRGRTSA